MNIEGFERVTFENVKSTIDVYTERLAVIKTEIEIMESKLKELETDEKIILDTVKSVIHEPVKSQLLQIVIDFQRNNDIDSMRSKVHDLYAERNEMTSDIKSLFIVGDFPSHICSLCLERPVDVFLRQCCHTYCSQCISKNKTDKCPMCRTTYAFMDVRTLIFS